MSQTDPLSIIRHHWKLVKEGTPDQLAGLINQLRPFLKPLARGLMPDWISSKADDSDVARDTSARALKGISQFQGDTAEEFWAWIITIQRNEINHLLEKFRAARRELTREQGLDAGETLADGRSPDVELNRQEANELREKVLLTLKPEDQMVIRLRVHSGKSLRETAELMGREYEAIKKMYARAIVKWKQAWDEQANNGEHRHQF